MLKQMAAGAAWMVLLRLFDRSVGLISTAILARLLLPADFGLVAMAMSVIAFIELATAFSFEVALIQKAEPRREHYDTAWTLNILLAAGGGLVTAALALPAASFYGDPRLAPVMWAIAAGWCLSGFENVGTVNFRREMNFGAEFRFMAGKRIVSFVVVMIAALTLRSYWALVIGTLAGRATGVALSYLLQPFRPRWSLAGSRDLFSVSGWVLANNIAMAALTRVPHFVIGRTHGAQALGAYTVGSEIALLAQTELVAPINRAMFPGYARLAHDMAEFRRTCLEATSAILMIVMPVSVGVAALAAPMVRVMLGSSWGEAVPVIQVLAFSGAALALTSNTFAVCLGLGRPYLLTVVLGVRLLAFAAAVAAFLRWGSGGVLDVAYAELLSCVLALLVSLVVLFIQVRISLRDYVASLWRPVLASAAMGGLLYEAVARLPGDGGILAAVAQLAVGAPMGAVVYVALIWCLWALSGRPATVEARVHRMALAWLTRVRRRPA
jgi:lipopolysaccharide exporter